jgi:DNA polymerase (family 10)
MDATNHGLPKPCEATEKVLGKLARLIEKHPYRYSAEKKEDGLAVSAGKTAAGPFLLSQKLDLVNKAPAMVAELERLLGPRLGDTVLQAEMIFRPDASVRERREDVASIALSKPDEAQRKIHERGRSPELMVYDILVDEGHSVVGEPFVARRSRLRRLFERHRSERVHLVESRPLDEEFTLERARTTALAEDWEGLVIKDGQAPTRVGATREDRPRLDVAWKWKPTRTIDVIADGWQEGEGKNKGRVGALSCRLVASEASTDVVPVGQVGSGLSDAQREQFKDATFPMVIEVKLQPPYFTRDGQMLMPSFVAVHPDKEPKECISPQDWPGRAIYEAPPGGGKENPMSNETLAAMLRRTADLLRIQNARENEFRIRSYEKAADVLQDMPVEIHTIENPESIDGIGESIGTKIQEFIKTGRFERLDELERTVPDIIDLMRLRGIGPVRARDIYQTTGAKTIEQLRRLIDVGRVTDPTIVAAVKEAHEARGKIRLDEAEALFSKIEKSLKSAVPEAEVLLAGSARRRTALVRDLDVVGVAESPEEQQRLLEAFRGLGAKPEGGDRRAATTIDGVRCEMLIAGPWERGAALATSTGSGVFNQEVRSQARSEGRLANSQGVFDRETKQKLDNGTEEDYFKQAGFQWLPPSIRTSVSSKVTIRRKDVNRDLHAHTTASGDGTLSLKDLITQALQRGLKAIAVTDHLVGPGFNAASKETVLKTYDAVDVWNASRPKGGSSPKVLKSGEVEIRGDGTIRGSKGGFVPDEIVERCDFLSVALHSPPKGCARVGQHADPEKQAKARETLTNILTRAFQHPKVRIWAHPTGRILGQRGPLDFDADRVLDAMKKHDVALEVNGQPKRMDAEEALVRKAIAKGVKIAPASDTHRKGDGGFLDNVLAILQRSGVMKSDIVKPGKKTRRGCRGRRGAMKSATA